MILVCPSCETRYFTQDTALGEGRRVRCASCGHAWYAKPDGGELATAEPSGLTREQVERLRQSAAENAGSGGAPHARYRAKETARRQRSRRMAAVLGWAIGALLFGSAAASAVVFREQVAAAWPRTATVYKMAGLEVNRFGLDLKNITARTSFDGTTPVVTVTGQAVNNGEKVRTSPQLRIGLKDQSGEEIQFWTAQMPVAEIKPGETVEFSSSLTGPAVERFKVAVTFIDRPKKSGKPAAEPGAPGAKAAAAHAPSAPAGKAGHDSAAAEAPAHAAGSGDAHAHSDEPEASAESHGEAEHH